MESGTADRPAGLLRHYSLSACVLHSGAFCGQYHYAAPHGYIYLVRRGLIMACSLVYEGLLVTEPNLLFYPRVASHRFTAAPGNTTEQLCTEVDLGTLTGNPLTMALSSMLLILLTDLSDLGPMLELPFAEAECDQRGQQAVIDRLYELLPIQLPRYLMDGRPGATGLLASLADPKLARAITAMHGAPQTAQSLEALAAKAGMSRVHLAAAFKDAVGVTPGDYLADWRVNVSCTLLKQGRPVAVVADRAGYGSLNAPARAFRVRMGCAPRDWLVQQRGDATLSGS